MRKIKDFLNGQTGVLILFWTLLAWSGYKAFKTDLHLKYYPQYSIAKCTGIEYQNSNTFMNYYFYVNGEKYKSSYYLGDNYSALEIGGYYRVKYSSKDPRINKLNKNIRFTDTLFIKEAGFNLK
ncbi:hypothetical protein [Flavobacterium sp. ASW18X]|uniref:hypothetical protein n=1 Tax=Flavobacterium sp. ASW18X TaxID=2572595 RepID=UPI0010AE6B15|nr:hypothetical protein [Flavobacterium sp. ASW18X]TKD63548.1 hypothetical protein FBT53_08210 [Flavobacterium sp. ASW18X]